MRRFVRLAALALVAACGGDGTGPDAEIPAVLVGRWGADVGCSPACSFTLTSTTNPQARLDIVAGLGIGVTVEVTATGRFTLGFSGGAPETGTVEVSGSTMYVRDNAGVVDTIDWRIEGELLHLDLRRLFHELDFDGNGTLDPARAAAKLEKR